MGRTAQHALGAYAEARVLDYLEQHGWKARRPSRGARHADLVVGQRGRVFVVEVKALAEGRADRALPLLSQAILQARAHAAGVEGASPLAILWVNEGSPALASRIRSFADAYAGGVPVGLLDDKGLAVFVGEPFDTLNSELKEKRPPKKAAPPIVNLFSDLNQWMLKILIANEVPDHLMTAPRIDCRTGADLAKAADVSAMSASRFLLQLRTEGFLEEGAQRLRLVRRKELFDRWRAANMRPAPELPLRFLLRGPVREQLQSLLESQPEASCLGLFAAADELKFGHVSGVLPHVCVQRLPHPGERKWRATRVAAAGEAPDFIVRQAAFPKSMFRGAVHRDGGSCSDIIQTWLDVANHPARGSEQAGLIYEKFLRQLVEPAPV